MFDIGFFELLIIAVVGLLVIGPERLPSAIRTVALWFGRIKRTIRETRQEVEKQLGADEIRRELHNEQVMRNLERMRTAHLELEQKIHNLDGTSPETKAASQDPAAGESQTSASSEPAPQAETGESSPATAEPGQAPTNETKAK